MITCNLQGGLGNQMFQIAATYALALRNNDTCGFNFSNCYTPLQGHTSTKYEKNIFKNITKLERFIPSKTYFEPKFSYTEIPYSSNILLNGYFQSELYFNDFEDEITNLFHFNDDDITSVKDFISKINKKNLPVTIIHIRRGDYLLNSDFHSVCPKEYYLNSIDKLNNNCYIFISDDIKWVKEEFNNDNFFYFESDNEILDLTLMTIADNVIISNSSFSWWGAYLNKNKDKKIIAPNSWFGKKGPKDTDTLIPKNWLKI
jgi:hypothetical protein